MSNNEISVYTLYAVRPDESRVKLIASTEYSEVAAKIPTESQCRLALVTEQTFLSAPALAEARRIDRLLVDENLQPALKAIEALRDKIGNAPELIYLSTLAAFIGGSE